MSKRFVLGDIHGNAKGLKQCLQRSNFDIEEDILIQLGDIVDRGPNVFKCVELLSEIVNFVGIRGNHDEWFSTYIDTGMHPTQWKQGGKATAASYLKAAGLDVTFQISSSGGYMCKLNPGDIPEKHKRFFNKQIDYYIDDDYNLFVHGGFNRHFDFKVQDRNVWMWDRDLWFAAMGYEQSVDKDTRPFKMYNEFNHVYIGHTATTNWATFENVTKGGIISEQKQRITKPLTCANITNLDTGSGNGKGKLTIMDLDTKEIFQSDLVKDLYPNNY